jgi:dUTP pyrophosphatase
MNISFKKTNDRAVLPTKNNESDTGFDVYSVVDTVVPARGSAVVDVGLQFADIPPGIWVKVEGRSGLGFKHGILPHPGIIDNGYRGDAGVKLYNLSDNDYTIKTGDRIAQFVAYPVLDVGVVMGTEIIESDRGEKGFGSSGR